VWEEELVGDCRGLLLNVILQDYILDQWIWRLDPTTGYTISGCILVFG